MENFNHRELKLLNNNFRSIIKKFETLHGHVNDMKNRDDLKRRIHRKVETITASYWKILQKKGVNIKFHMYRAWLGIYIMRKQLPHPMPEEIVVYAYEEPIAA